MKALSLLALVSLVGCSAAATPEDAVQDESAFSSSSNSSTCHPKGGETHARLELAIDTYKGLRHSSTGTHEAARAHIVSIDAADNAKIITNAPIDLEMNVASSRDESGLPKEIPLTRGQIITVEGIYIDTARSSNGSAVVHFTHAPCGSVTIDGTHYSG